MKDKPVLIDYLMSYPLRQGEGKTDSVISKVQCLAELRPDCRVRLFAPYCDYRPSLPANATLISQKRVTVRLVQELWLNVVYLYALLRGRPACLIVRPDALFVGHVIAKAFGVRLILNVHSCVMEESRYVYRSAIGRIYIYVVHAIFLLSLKLADGIVFNHPDLRQYVIDKYAYKRPSRAIYNGANTTRFFPLDKRRAREQLAIAPDRTMLLFLGSAAQWHGVEYLLALAAELEARGSDIVTYIVGGRSDGDEHVKTLAAEAPKNVVCTGKVDIDVANLYVNASDICLLPVKKIRVSPGSPRKLFDYIAVGRPVVAQEDTTGYSDIVLSYQVGYTVDFRDSRAAADALEKIVRECDRDHYAVHNRNVAINELSWRNVAGKWSEFVDAIVAGRCAETPAATAAGGPRDVLE